MLIRKTSELVKSVYVGAKNAIVAGSGTDNTKVTGSTINRKGYDSALLSIAGSFALTDTKTLSYAIEIQESADGSTWDTAEALVAATVVKTADSTTTFVGVSNYEVDLSMRKQYVRFNITADLNAANTDAGCWGAVAILGNAETQPQTQSFTW